MTELAKQNYHIRLRERDAAFKARLLKLTERLIWVLGAVLLTAALVSKTPDAPTCTDFNTGMPAPCAQAAQ